MWRLDELHIQTESEIDSFAGPAPAPMEPETILACCGCFDLPNKPADTFTSFQEVEWDYFDREKAAYARLREELDALAKRSGASEERVAALEADLAAAKGELDCVDVSALASDECSKALIYESWQGVAAFTNVYGCTAGCSVYQSDWSASVCTEP